MAEADAEEDENVADGLQRHAHFAREFVVLTMNELRALEREVEQTEVEARVAAARSRGESPFLYNVQRSVFRQQQHAATGAPPPRRRGALPGPTRTTK